MSGSASAPAQARPSYDEWAKRSVQRAWDPTEGGEPEGWLRPVAQIGSGVVYALLDIARAIREQS